MKRHGGIFICLGLACLSFSGKGSQSVGHQENVTATRVRVSPGDQLNWSVMSSGGTIGTSSMGKLEGTFGQLVVGEMESNPQPWISADSTDTVCAVLANGFWHNFDDTCCVGLTGNVDCDPEDGVDISDLSALIDNLYISITPLCCKGEANIDGDINCGIDISDLTRLIDYLYISFLPPSACQ